MFIISDDRQRIVSGSFSGLYNQLKTEYDARRQEERFFKGAYFSDNIASFYKEKYKSAISSFSQLNDAQKFFIAIQYAETHDGHRTTVSLEALWQRGVCQKKPASLVGGISSSAFPTC